MLLSSGDALAPVVALLLLALPALAGWSLGRWVRHPLAGVAVVVLTALAVSADVVWRVWQVWDVLGIALVFLGALLLRVSEVPPARVGRGLLTVGVFAVAAEVAARAVLPDAPEFAEPAIELPPWMSGQTALVTSDACPMMFPSQDAGAALLIRQQHTNRVGTAGFVPVQDGRPVVLHLGDSMLTFSGPPDSADPLSPTLAVARLGTRDPDRNHVNLGVPGSSYDAMVVITRVALERWEVEEVVLWAFLQNDLAELGRSYPCCRGQAVVDMDTPAAPNTCAEADPPLLNAPRLDFAVRHSQDPILVRVAARWSLVVGHLRGRLHHTLAFRGPLATSPAFDDERLGPDETARRWGWTRNILTALRDRLAADGVRLTIVAMPVGIELPSAPEEPEQFLRPAVDRMAQLADDLAIPFVDAWPALIATGTPHADLFLADGYHLSDAGHARLADYMAPRLGLTTP